MRNVYMYNGPVGSFHIHIFIVEKKIVDLTLL